MIDLGLDGDYFWNLTLPLFLRLLERHRARERQLDRRAGVAAAAIYEVHRNPEIRQDPFTWMDLFPEHKPEPEPMTDEDIMDVMDKLAMRMGVE